MAPKNSNADAREPKVVVCADVLDPELGRVYVSRPRNGAVLVFSGDVRDVHEGRRVESVTYEAYAEMAVSELRSVAAAASKRHGAADVAIYHRVGKLKVGETSLVVAVGTPHRAAAFACGLEIIDELKKRAPIWKTEHGAGGERVQDGFLPQPD